MPAGKINEGFDLMKRGESIRGVVIYRWPTRRCGCQRAWLLRRRSASTSMTRARLVCRCASVFLPAGRCPAMREAKVPAIVYLAGLTCNEETFMIKAGAQRRATELGIALIAPDTSPEARRTWRSR